MKQIACRVEVKLVFENLSLEEAMQLESFVYASFEARDEWGEPKIDWNITQMGEKEPKAQKKSMTSKKVLELEKEGKRGSA